MRTVTHLTLTVVINGFKNLKTHIPYLWGAKNISWFPMVCNSQLHLLTMSYSGNNWVCVFTDDTWLALLLGGLQTKNHNTFISSGMAGKLPWIPRSTALNSFCTLWISIHIFRDLTIIFTLNNWILEQDLTKLKKCLHLSTYKQTVHVSWVLRLPLQLNESQSINH